jgi:hypothetical protein
MFDALCKRSEAERKYRDFHVGIVASTVANFSYSPPKEPLTPSDFMPTGSKPHLDTAAMLTSFASSLSAKGMLING